MQLYRVVWCNIFLVASAPCQVQAIVFRGCVTAGIRAFKDPGKRQRMASRQNSDARLMGPPPPVQVADSSTTPIGTPGQLPPIKIYTPSPLGQTYAPAKESTTAFALPVRCVTFLSKSVADAIIKPVGRQHRLTTTAAVVRIRAVNFSSCVFSVGCVGCWCVATAEASGGCWRGHATGGPRAEHDSRWL